MRATWMVSMLLLVAGGAHAGRLELTNGAVIPGEYARVEGNKLVWKADLIGEIRVDQQDVARVDSTVAAQLRVDRDELPRGCTLAGRGADLTVSCPGRAAVTTHWDDIGRPGRLREGSGKVTTALTFERGNSYSDELDADARAKWRRTNLRHNLEASIDYEEKRTGKTEDEASLDYQLDYVYPSDWYVYGRAEYYRDRFASVQEGLLGGVGIGRTWTFFSDLNVLLQAGPDYGRFDIQELGRLNESGGNVQWRIDYEFGLWRWDLTLFHEGDYRWVLRDSDLNRVETKSGLELPIAAGLIAELRLEYDRIGVNLPTIDNTDVEWVFALGYKW